MKSLSAFAAGFCAAVGIYFVLIGHPGLGALNIGCAISNALLCMK